MGLWRVNFVARYNLRKKKVCERLNWVYKQQIFLLEKVFQDFFSRRGFECFLDIIDSNVDSFSELFGY